MSAIKKRSGAEPKRRMSSAEKAPIFSEIGGLRSDLSSLRRVPVRVLAGDISASIAFKQTCEAMAHDRFSSFPPSARTPGYRLVAIRDRLLNYKKLLF